MIRLIMVIMTMCILTACSSPVTDAGKAEQKTVTERVAVMESIKSVETISTADEKLTTSIEPIIEPTQIPLTESTAEPTPVVTEQATSTIDKSAPSMTVKPKAKPTKQPTPEISAKPTQAPTPIATEKPAPIITAKPTEKPTPVPTPEPTQKPVAGEGYMDEMTSASSSYINSVLSAINKKRKANGLDNAILDSSLSSSCKSHAKSMASSGNAFHSSNVVGCEGVSRNHYSMPAGTLGAAMVAHVGQLATSDTNKIGIGVIYYGNYMYVCIRGVG